jgi:predicted translin family RNA/ssDNA-binding protein
MAPSATFKTIRRQYEAREKARRFVAARGDEAARTAKKAIFALHRDEFRQAEILLLETRKIIESCQSELGRFPDLRGEGPYAAGLEEYAEAQLFAGYVKTGKLGAIEKKTMEPTVYLGGLCDATGEIVRYAMRQATLGRHEAVGAAFGTVEGVVNFLLDMDLTGYLRTKFDQAKRNLRTLEQMDYEHQIRKAPSSNQQVPNERSKVQN